MNLEEKVTKEQEGKESEPKALATIFIVRHGESKYREQKENPEVESDLTEQGVSQVKDLADVINSKIKEGEKVYLMKSPRIRAQNTAGILKEHLLGHEVIELGKGRPSLDKLKDFNEQGEEVKYVKSEKERYLEEIAKIIKQKG